MTTESLAPASRRTEATSPIAREAGALERGLQRLLRSGRAGLPILPAAASEALRLAGDPLASIVELGRLIDRDPPIAARFLSVANSAAYSRGIETTSIESAVVRLGLTHARDLLFQAVYAASTMGLKRHQLAVRASFTRSVDTAIAARVLAREVGAPGEYAYMAGLLHDIGEARVYRVLASLPEPSHSDPSAQELCARYHCEAGAELARSWRLPPPIVDACAAHHDPEALSNPTVRLVALADAVIDAMYQRERDDGPIDPAAFSALEVDPARVEPLVALVASAVRQSESELGSSRRS